MGRGSQRVYASVKSYSQRGKLLSRSDLQTLAESRDLEEYMTRLKNTIYADSVTDVEKPYTAQKIESALRGYLAERHYSIAKTAGDSDILSAYYLKFVIWNLKLILKGKILNKTQEDLEPLLNLRAEELIRERDVIIKALVTKDIEETVASLSSIQFSDEVAKAVELYKEKKNLQIFDTYFDKILYQQLAKALKSQKDKQVIRIVSMDVDFYNLLSVIRGKFWNLDEQQIQDLIVSPTSSAPRELLNRLIAAASVRDALNELNTTRYKTLVPQIDNEMDALAEFERNFEKELYKTTLRSFTKMFSFSTIIAITKLTGYEVRNLAAIAFAVEQKIPLETTMSKLIIESE